MANKTQYFSNFGSLFGPMELNSIRPKSRALIIGARYDFSNIKSIRQYFDLIISEDESYAESLSDPADILFWQSGSPYLNGVMEFPFTSDSLLLVNFYALKKLASSSAQVQTYNLAYLPDGQIGTLPSVTKGVLLGLDPLMSGNHLAKIMGATEIYDTENRAGTLAGKPSDIKALIDKKTNMGVSTFFRGPRLSLLERI